MTDIPWGSAPLPHGARNHQRPDPRRLFAPQPARIAPALPSRGRSPSDAHLSPTGRHLPDGYVAFHDRDTGAVDRSGPPAPFSSPLKPRHENPRPKGQIMPASTAGVVQLNLRDAAQCEWPTPRSWPVPRPMRHRLGSPACPCRRCKRRCRSHHRRRLRPAIGPGAAVRYRRRDARGLQRRGPATLPHHVLASPGGDRRGQREPGCSGAFADGRRRTSRRSRIPWCACRTSPCTSKDIWQSWTSIR
jgi:hypothetical protein